MTISKQSNIIIEYCTNKERNMAAGGRTDQMKTTINQRLVESGEKERLKEKLKHRLSECGWRDELKEHARGILQERGLDNIRVDDLVQEITPKGRGMVPGPVKQELLQEIKTFLQNQDIGM